MILLGRTACIDNKFCFVILLYMKQKKIKKKVYQFPVIIEQDENGVFIGRVPSLRSCYTYARTLPELYDRLQEVVALCLEVEKEYFHDIPEQNKFLGVQQLEFSA